VKLYTLAQPKPLPPNCFSGALRNTLLYSYTLNRILDQISMVTELK